MKANELRIGNWIYDAECAMTIKIGTGLHLHNLHPQSKPIPLTEEWLIKLGFKEVRRGQFRLIDKSADKRLGYVDDRNWSVVDIYYWEWIATGENASGYEFKWHDEHYANHQKQKVIKYVHQLQNLYFALTGEELYEK